MRLKTWARALPQNAHEMISTRARSDGGGATNKDLDELVLHLSPAQRIALQSKVEELGAQVIGGVDSDDGVSVGWEILQEAMAAGLVRPNRTFHPKDRARLRTFLIQETSDRLHRGEHPLLQDLCNEIGGALDIERLGVFKAIAATTGDVLMSRLTPKEDGRVTASELDAQMRMIAQHWWAQTYGKGMDDAKACETMSKRSPDNTCGEALRQFMIKWAGHAFQTLTTSHSYASALMCSDVDRMALEGLPLPWAAFAVVLPDKLLEYTRADKAVVSLTRLWVGVFDHRAMLLIGYQVEGRIEPSVTLLDAPYFRALLDVKHPLRKGDASEELTTPEGQRIVVLCKRLVAGLLFTLQEPGNTKVRTVAASRPKGKGRTQIDPAHRLVVVGKPLKVDCRPAMRDFIDHGSPKRKGAPPSVQTLVRGHFRQQACGPRWQNHKTLWIEPFWRGPEEARILTRVKIVQGHEPTKEAGTST